MMRKKIVATVPNCRIEADELAFISKDDDGKYVFYYDCGNENMYQAIRYCDENIEKVLEFRDRYFQI